jgi:hypothetical protein
MELMELYAQNREWVDGGVITVLCEDVPFTSALPVDTGDYKGALSYRYRNGTYRLAVQGNGKRTVQYASLQDLVAWLDNETETYIQRARGG